jgi:hypothetical protein
MSKVEAYPPGTFAWADLTAQDTEKAKQFYSQLFGWESEDIPVSEGMVYTIMRKNGADAAAIAPPPQDFTEGRPAWNSYISVDNVDDTARRAQELGAKVIMEPMDSMDAGRMAVIQDPQGATFMLWQPNQSIGAKVVNEPGALVWNELYSNDRQGSIDFYTKLFGWTADTQKMPGGIDYVIFKNKGRGAAGLMEITPSMGEMPPMWTVYFAVDDVDKALAQVEEAGGKRDFDPMSIPDLGTFVMVEDPVGAHVFLMQMVREPEPLPQSMTQSQKVQ